MSSADPRKSKKKENSAKGESAKATAKELGAKEAQAKEVSAKDAAKDMSAKDPRDDKQVAKDQPSAKDKPSMTDKPAANVQPAVGESPLEKTQPQPIPPEPSEKAKTTPEEFEKTGPLEIEPKPAPSKPPVLMGKGLAGILVCAVVIAAAWLAMGTANPPAPVAASALPTEFSSERAMTHLKIIAAAPHPLGSAEHGVVQAYIVDELKKAGLEPQVQTATGVTPRYVVAGTVQNIVARLPGAEKSPKALALVAHYDSVPAAPGAGDDGAGVAAMLETLRALKAGPPLKNDIIFLITDGEENGLLGASAFADEHPWASDIGAVLNFEGRGKSGASLMFETASGNAWLVDAFAKTPHPRGSSLAYEIYKRMPNDTDFTVFKKHGAQGLNFAYVDDWYAYHTAHDSPDRINQGSVQHHGEEMLALARELGNADLSASHSAANAVYFNLAGNALIHYSSAIGVGLAVLAALLYVFVLWRELKQKRTILLGVVWGAGIFVLSLALAALTGAVVLWKMTFVHRWIVPDGDVVRSGVYMLSLVTWIVTLNVAMYSLWRNKLGASGLALGGLFFWVLLAVWSALAVPGASYLFTWPLLGALLAVAMFRSTGEEARAGVMEILALVIGALPCALLFGGTLQQVFVTLGLTTFGMYATCVLVTLAVWVLIPQVELMTRQHRWLLPLTAWVVCVLVFFWGMATTRYSAEHPRADAIFYGRNADTGKAVWFATGDKPDDWTKQFLSEQPEKETLEEFFPGGAGTTFLKHDAPDAPLAGADVLLGDEKKEGDGRTLTLLVMSPRKAQWVTLYVSDADVAEASVNGKPIIIPDDARRLPSKGWRLRYSNPPEQGIEVMLKVRGTGRLKVQAVDGSYGLPSLAGTNVTPRPDWIVPVQTGDATLVTRTFTF